MATDVYRTLAGEAHFTPWYREREVLFHDIAISDLKEIEFRFHIGATIQPPNVGSAFVGAEDIRLYVNEHDVTPDVIAEVQRLVAKVPVDEIKRNYLECVQNYLRFIEAFGTHNEQVAGDWEFAQNYAESGMWPDKFTSLGDRTIGWSGNLHPLNFLHKLLPTALSLSAIWRSYVQRTGLQLPTKLSQLSSLLLTFSSGPCPTFDAIDPGFVPGGVLRYQFDLATENPLKESLRQIASRIRTLQRSLESVRLNYLDPLQADVQNIETEVTNGNTSLGQALDRLRTTVENIAGP